MFKTLNSCSSLQDIPGYHNYNLSLPTINIILGSLTTMKDSINNLPTYQLINRLLHMNSTRRTFTLKFGYLLLIEKLSKLSVAEVNNKNIFQFRSTDINWNLGIRWDMVRQLLFHHKEHNWLAQPHKTTSINKTQFISKFRLNLVNYSQNLVLVWQTKCHIELKC